MELRPSSLAQNPEKEAQTWLETGSNAKISMFDLESSSSGSKNMVSLRLLVMFSLVDVAVKRICSSSSILEMTSSSLPGIS